MGEHALVEYFQALSITALLSIQEYSNIGGKSLTEHKDKHASQTADLGRQYSWQGLDCVRITYGEQFLEMGIKFLWDACGHLYNYNLIKYLSL